MNLSQDKFNTYRCRFLTTDRIPLEGTRYEYWTNKASYEVIIFDNDTIGFRKNMKAVLYPEPIHQAICDHYDIKDVAARSLF